MKPSRVTGLIAAALTLALLSAAAPASAEFPYTRPGADPTDYQDLYLHQPGAR